MPAISFMVYFCYILYSNTVNKYYTGSTTNLEERIKLHNNGYFGGKSYSYKASDWELYLKIACKSLEEARRIELKIKRMKSRKYIENLKKYPEMLEKFSL